MKRVRFKVACGVMSALFLTAGLAVAQGEDASEADANWAKKAADAGKKAAENANSGKKPDPEASKKKAAAKEAAFKEAAAKEAAAKEAAAKEAAAKETAAKEAAAKQATVTKPAPAPAVGTKTGTVTAEATRKEAVSSANADAAKKPGVKKAGDKKRKGKKNPAKVAERKAAEAKKKEAAKPAPKAATKPVAKKPSASAKPKAPVQKPPPPGAVQIARVTTVAATVLGKDAILDECQIETSLPAAIAERNPNVFLIDKPTAGGTVLTLKIVEMRAPGGGILSGPKGITVDGRLVAGGKLRGTFTAKETSMASMSNCGMLSKVIFELAGDIGAWLDQPDMNTRLGNAR